MLKWALIFLVVSLVAGALGMTPIARGAATVSKILFGIFALFMIVVVVLVILALMAGDALF